MSDLQVIGLSGIRAARTASHRTIFRQGDYNYLAQGKIIHGAVARDPGNTGDVNVLRAGLLMGMISATGLYAPSLIGVTTGAYTSGGTTITVSAAQATEIVRRVGSSGTATLRVIGPPTAAGTVAVTSCTFSAVDTTTGIITITSLGVDKVAGSFVTAADGSQLPLTLIPDGYGIQVTDVDGSDVDVSFPQFPISGVIVSASIVNWPSDTSLRTWIRTNLSSVSQGKFVFDDLYGI